MLKGITSKNISNFCNKFTVLKNGCWQWFGATSGNGKYSGFQFQGKNISGHIFSYLLKNKSMKSNLEIDHLCRNTLCVNPKHLEAVTRAENRFRARKKFCKRGHQFFWKERKSGGGRNCMECDRRVAMERFYQRKLRAEIIP